MRTAAICRSGAAVLAGMMLSLPAWSTPAGGTTHVTAQWAPRHIQFIYQGFTTQYSCDGLREKIRGLLSKLGARDLKVREVPCSTSTGPDPFPGVRVSMQVLVPAGKAGKAGKADKSAARVPAHWHKVVLAPSHSDYDWGGECELIEQFKESFLPLFTTRDTHFSTTCVPHQVSLDTSLTTEVLVPDHPAAKRS